MKSVTLSSADDKNLVRKALPTSNGSGVIWEQELYEGFNYMKDASYFHSFETDDCLTALEFADEGEADVFFKKVQGRDSLAAKATMASTASSTLGHRKTPSFSNTLNKRKSKIDKNHIGMPADFRHVGHIGYTPGKGFSVQNNDPEWNGIFEQLKELGISADEINDNQEFIQDFLQQNGTTLPSSPPPLQQQPPSVTTAPPPIQTSRKKAPPPPPPPGRHHAPPPPPPPRRSNNNHSSPPPPPPARHPGPPVPNRGRPVPAPPPIPSMGNGSFAPPPPPPPPPMGNVPPPPPPPPMSSSNGAPAAPPPPPPMGVPPPSAAAAAGGGGGGDGRSNLMASIRAAGGFGTLKLSGKLREAEASAPPTPSMAGQAAGAATGAAAGAAGGSLASSLADVLKQRQQAMQSDDEDDDDDEWE
ncbi:hypothetical protein MAM1_0296c09360 [Mucor ambiguus]|uniref:Uncharacterized protein n=1 Tax=Mucor ambiguus TaxID=91626 RepID=A0A0C9N1I5_9FUNG|nr:hypothetical protein MAM1_0296c09360 [Mucor ambiguus]